MSHHTATICAEHKAVQTVCRCPAPITSVTEEECLHGELNDESLFWSGTTIVRGYELITPAPPDTVTILRSDLNWLLTEYHQPKDVLTRCWTAYLEGTPT